MRSFVYVTDGSLAFLWMIGVCVRPYISEKDGSLASLSPIGTCIRPKIDIYCRHLGISSVFLCPTPFIDVPTRHIASVTTGNKTKHTECIFAL